MTGTIDEMVSLSEKIQGTVICRYNCHGRYNNEPSIEPWGAPKATVVCLDVVELASLTDCCWFNRCLSN